MRESKSADKKTAMVALCVLFAAALVLAGVLFAANVRLTPMDVTGCEAPPETMRWEIVKLEGEGTVLFEGWAVEPGADRISTSVTALLRDPTSGLYYRVPTASRALDELSSGGDGVADDLSLTEEEAARAGFFARGVPLGASGSGRELYLLFDDGAHRYLIDTDRSI